MAIAQQFSGVGGTAANPFTITPASQGGTGVFGQVPGVIGLPPVEQQLQSVLPGLQGSNAEVGQDILSNLQGNLSPGTQNALQNSAADTGVSTGMPGSNLDWNSLYGNIAGASTSQQQTGLQEYDSTIPTVSGTQTVAPDLETQVAYQNAVDAASPNPVDSGVADIGLTIGNQLLGGSGYSTTGGAASGGGGGCY